MSGVPYTLLLAAGVAFFVIQAGSLMIALGLGIAGIQGLRGVPVHKGETTSKMVSAILLAVAAVMVIFEFVVLPQLLVI
jgi:hypothetical protein